MQTDYFQLPAGSPGQQYVLKRLRFGPEGEGPKAYIQAALHADEIPAMLVAHHLQAQLSELEQRGQLRGEVHLVPYANPIGLAQLQLGQLQGRFDARDGVNFNRGFAELAAMVAPRIEQQLSEDRRANTRLIQRALAAAASGLPAQTPAQHLKRQLLLWAVDADVVLDLHSDNEAELHLYALDAQAETAAELGALLGARAVLLASESGDSPFDEACSRPWALLRQRFAQRPIDLGCFASTVELRGEADVEHSLARQDAAAIIDFLQLRGLVAGVAPQLPVPLCRPTPLAAAEPIVATRPGLVVFHKALGERVCTGELVAEVICPDSGQVELLASQADGVVFARSHVRWAVPGSRLAKVAGTTVLRSGKLLSP